VEAGPHRIGDTVTVEVTLGEQEFVDELDQINVSLRNNTDFGVVDSVRLTEAGTAVLEATVTGPVTQWWVTATDRSGLEFTSSSTVMVVAASGDYDYNGDGATDFIARRSSDGTTFLYPGTGSGTHGARVSWGTALKGMTLIATAGDLNGDGSADILARTSGGTLYVYPGNGSGALDTAGRITIGSGWNGMGTIVGGHDHNADGKDDVIAVGSDGTLWLYPGTGAGRLGARTSIGTGWTSMSEVTAAGDLDHDGRADLLAVKKSDGCLYFYGGTGNGTFKSRVQIGCGWGTYDAITGVGDFNGDGHADWLARRKSDGNLFLYKGDGAGSHTSRSQIGTAWNSMMIA
jgi:hypothetical protein